MDTRNIALQNELKRLRKVAMEFEWVLDFLNKEVEQHQKLFDNASDNTKDLHYCALNTVKTLKATIDKVLK